MKKIAVVNDISGFGKCSLTAAIPIISALGVQCCPLVTGVFSNQTGYPDFYCRDLSDDMEPCIEQWKKLGAEFDGILTGFIANSRQGEIIGRLIDSFRKEKTIVAVDPVMADDGEIYKCYDEDCVKAIISLAKKADIITPNLTELCLLSGEAYSSVQQLGKEKKLAKIREMSGRQGNKIVVTSGVHLGEKEIANTVWEKGSFNVIVTPYHCGSFSGTGDILASFITTQAVKGVPIEPAVRQASQFICKAIEETIRETDGRCNPPDGVHFEKLIAELKGL